MTSETVRLRGLFQHSLSAVLSREMVRPRGLFQHSPHGVQSLLTAEAERIEVLLIAVKPNTLHICGMV